MPPLFVDTYQAFGAMPGGHPDYRKNQDKATCKVGALRCPADASVCCAYCGRYTGSGSLFVFLTALGEFTESEAHADDNGALGMYPVGSDCAKKLKKAGIPLYKLIPDDGIGTFKRI